MASKLLRRVCSRALHVLPLLGILVSPSVQVSAQGVASAERSLSRVQRSAADEPGNEVWTELMQRGGSAIPWIRDPYQRIDLSRRGTRVQPYNPKVDRKILLAEALRQAKASKRMVLLYAFRIEGRQMYRAPLLDAYMKLAVFSDPELVELIRRKFVALRLYVDKEVGEGLGIINKGFDDPLFLKTVEPALVFLSPEGKVLHVVDRLRTFSVSWTRSILLRVLRKHARYAHPSARLRSLPSKSDVKDPAALANLANELCLEGEEAAALSLLDRKGKAGRSLSEKRGEIAKLLAERKTLEASKEKDAQKKLRSTRRKIATLERRIRAEARAQSALTLVRAKALRLLRRVEDAMQLLRGARESGAGDPQLAAEELRCAILLGKHAVARELCALAPKDSETAWWRGCIEFASWNLPEAERWFRIAVGRGGAPYTWKAAAMLARSDDTSAPSPLAHGYELLRLASEESYRGPLPRSSERGDPQRSEKDRMAVVHHALDFLLAAQGPDGSWVDSRYAYWPSPAIVPNVRMAITALSASALLTWRDLAPKRVDAALSKAERYILEDKHIAQGTEEEVYSQAYRILYFVRKADRLSAAERKPVFANLDALIAQAKAAQNKNTGFFAHEYDNSFCSSAMLWSLREAMRIGVKVDEDMIRMAVKAIASARRADGSFQYGGSLSTPGEKGSISSLKNASARMPVCESVLHQFGSSDAKKVDHAFATFLEYLGKLARVRKCDFHSDGQLGGFFFWHAVFHASEARVILGKKRRHEVERRLLELVLRIPEIDGSFVDSHELGKSYGTAMALLTLGNLLRKS